MTTRADAHDDEFHKDQSWKFPVACATTANITLSGEQTIDGILTSASRVLVKDQGTGANNGIYKSGSGAWTRAYDMDTGLEAVGSLVKVVGGTVNGGKFFMNTNTSTVTIGSTALTFSEIGAAAAALLTTKGDLHTYSSVDARLAVGTNGQSLTADSGQTTGLRWATHEVLMVDGITSPPEPMTTEDGTDWLYEG